MKPKKFHTTDPQNSCIPKFPNQTLVIHWIKDALCFKEPKKRMKQEKSKKRKNKYDSSSKHN